MKVIGLDLSLRSTGVSGGRWAEAVRIPDRFRGPERHHMLLEALGEYVEDAALVVVEGGALGLSGPRNHEELTGLRQMVNLMLWRRGIPYAIVSPSVRAKYGAGKGNADKETVRREVQWRYGVTLEGPARYDEADALVLANMGWHWLGTPLVLPPEGYSLKGKWPEEAVAEVLRAKAAAHLQVLRGGSPV